MQIWIKWEKKILIPFVKKEILNINPNFQIKNDSTLYRWKRIWPRIIFISSFGKFAASLKADVPSKDIAGDKFILKPTNPIVIICR